MAKRTRGRPALPKAERKRGIFTFRATDALRQRVADSAKQSGRSISEELEYRVEESYRREDISKAVAKEVRSGMTATINWAISKSPDDSEEMKKSLRELAERISKPRESTE